MAFRDDVMIANYLLMRLRELLGALAFVRAQIIFMKCRHSWGKRRGFYNGRQMGSASDYPHGLCYLWEHLFPTCARTQMRVSVWHVCASASMSSRLSLTAAL